jgi:DNA-binding transcriptional ArsR family regulator
MPATLNLDVAFSALADPTRWAILARLAKGEATVMELAKPFEMTQPAISQHLKVLDDAGLVAGRVDGSKRRSAVEIRNAQHRCAQFPNAGGPRKPCKKR